MSSITPNSLDLTNYANEKAQGAAGTIASGAIASGEVLKAVAHTGTAALPGDTNGFINRTFALPSFTPRSAASQK